MVTMTSFCMSSVMAGGAAAAAGSATAESKSSTTSVRFIVVLPGDRFDSLCPVGQGEAAKVPGAGLRLAGEANTDANGLGQGERGSGGVGFSLPAAEASDFTCEVGIAIAGNAELDQECVAVGARSCHAAAEAAHQVHERCRSASRVVRHEPAGDIRWTESARGPRG